MLNLKPTDSVYFAHSKLDYNTVVEERALKAIIKAFLCRVIDPNTDLGEQGDIRPYLAAINKCRAVVVLEHDDHVGRGVYEEVQHAMNTPLCMPVLALRNWRFFFVRAQYIVDPMDWKNHYGRLKCDLRKSLNFRKKL